MPPERFGNLKARRTGPRRRRRVKQSAPRHFIILGTDTIDDLVTAHRIELVDGNLVLRDHNDAISRIHASGEWREIRPATMADMRPDYLTPPVEPPIEPDERPAEETDEVAREQATLINDYDPVFQLTRKEEADRLKSQEPFVPSSPEEAQRILMELHRRLAPNPAVNSGTPDYQDPPDAPSQPPPRKD